MIARRILFVVIALLPLTAYGQPTPATSDDIKELKAMIQRLTDTVTEQQADIGSLRKQQVQLSDFEKANRDQLEQIVNRDAAGKLYVRIDASQQEMKEQLQTAINSVTPKKGKVLVENHRDVDEYIVVQGTQYFVMHNAKLPPIELPLGEFRFRVRGEQEKIGFLLPGKYEQKLYIESKFVAPVVPLPYYTDYFVSQWSDSVR